MHALLVLILFAQAPPASTTSCRELLLQAFPKLDVDKSGGISLDEIDCALSNPEVIGPTAAAISALRRATRSKITPLPTPVTRMAIETPDADNSGSKMEANYKLALRRIRETPRELFTDRPPCLPDIHQGRVGDCFCLAPLGGWLHRDSESIRALFHQQDGKIEVYAGGRWIPVTPLTDGEIAILATSTGGGTWVNYYEKAMGICRREGERTPSASPLAAINKGGSAGNAMQALTGHETARFSCAPFKQSSLKPDRASLLLDELRIRLAHNQAGRQLACAGTGTTTLKVPGILGNHAYAVLDYDAKADTVTFWNPHGNSFTPKGKPGISRGYPTKNGIFSVPTTQAVVVFAGFSFETGGLAGPTRP